MKIWKLVLFSDESKFIVFNSDGSRHVLFMYGDTLGNVMFDTIPLKFIFQHKSDFKYALKVVDK